MKLSIKNNISELSGKGIYSLLIQIQQIKQSFGLWVSENFLYLNNV